MGTGRLASRVLLIGWDAADWRFIRPLLDAGAMPALRRLIESGVRGNLASLQPMLSPMLWNSIATGKRPAKHGILGFTEVAPDGQSVRTVSSTSRKCKALWNILAQSQLRSLVVGWYASHPAEPIAGVIVSNVFDAPAGPIDRPWPVVEGSVHPPELAEELKEFRVHPAEIRRDALSMFVPQLRDPAIDVSKMARLPKLRQLIAQSSTIHAVATHLLSTQTWDFAGVYYEGIDRFGHEFMHCHPPRHGNVSEVEFDLYRHVMDGCYRFHDMMLDALLAAAGEDVTVLLVSDHGYELGEHRPADVDLAGPTDWHHPFGVICAAGRGIKSNQQIFGGSVLDVTPTVLTLLGLPVGADMDGRPLLEAFDRTVEVERILSWDQKPGDAGMHSAAMAHDPAAAREAIDQLVRLGYIAAPSEDASKLVVDTQSCNDLNLVISLLDARQPGAAEPILRALLERDPANGTLLVQLARCLAAMGKLEEAEALANRVAPDSPLAPRASLLLAALSSARGDHDRALRQLTALSDANPALQGLHARLGGVYLDLKQWSHARRQFEAALAHDPHSAVAHDGLCQVAIARGEFEAAVDHALDAVGLAHYFPRAHFNLGRALAGNGVLDAAIESALLALRLTQGNYPAADVLLAELYQATGDASSAYRHRIAASSPSWRKSLSHPQ